MDRTPEELFRHMLGLLTATDMDAIADLWAPDGTVTFPFADGGAPTHLEGRENIRAYLAGYPDVYAPTAIPAARVHHTADPATIVAEFSAEGRTVRTGAPYRIDYITVITAHHGLITEARDYWSPVQTARAAGHLDALREGLHA